ncbi:undecaprenyl-diphosphate phosphatase [Alkalihalobacterium elongatum]|uniref:undecaprenyl-diphosphate phosphatase n=1 Tax=Alkalihalobacterium elongatum TaxID=2675466 RepID=UPI001C200B14|nr:undecaprenyl-diphosphate phosphatase [Alkalihalobacterium elongatum]
MNWFEALLLGIIQGISEFLPISSSAHLVIAEKLLGITMSTGNLTFEVLLHAASLLAVICFFWRDLLEIIKDFFSYLIHKTEKAKTNYRFAWLIVGATLITMGVGKGIEGFIGDRITQASTIGAALIVTGLFLILIEHGINVGNRTVKEMTWKDCIIIGFGQALAVIPGISRAGSTLIVALWCGLDKETAVRYSFLLSIPVILGITILKLPELTAETFAGVGFELAIACLASFIFAIIGIKWLIQMLNQAKLTYFAIYCIALGTITWIFLKDITI